MTATELAFTLEQGLCARTATVNVGGDLGGSGEGGICCVSFGAWCRLSRARLLGLSLARRGGIGAVVGAVLFVSVPPVAGIFLTSDLLAQGLLETEGVVGQPFQKGILAGRGGNCSIGATIPFSIDVAIMRGKRRFGGLRGVDKGDEVVGAWDLVEEVREEGGCAGHGVVSVEECVVTSLSALSPHQPPAVVGQDSGGGRWLGDGRDGAVDCSRGP